MRNIIAALVVLLFVVGLGMASEVSKDCQKGELKKMDHIIEVENLKCGGCANTIKQKLSVIEGVEEIVVEPEKSKVGIKAGKGLDLEKVKKTLSELGYPPVGSKNSVGKKAKSFVSCALGKLK
jgi:copper chaperone CopZ